MARGGGRILDNGNFYVLMLFIFRKGTPLYVESQILLMLLVFTARFGSGQMQYCDNEHKLGTCVNFCTLKYL